MASDAPLWINVPFSIHERPFLKRVLRGIEAYADRQKRWRIRLPYFYSATPLLGLAWGRGCRIDGQISGVPTREHLRFITARRVPTVLLNCPPPVPSRFANVELDFAHIAGLAVEHFLDQGIGDIAYFGSLHPDRSDHRRYAGAVRQACVERGLALRAHDRGGAGEDEGIVSVWQPRLRAWVKSLPAGTGIICADDEYAARIYLATHKAGLQIGEDLFVLGLGNEETFCEAMVPPLSSVQLDYAQIGWEAAKLLDRLMAGRPPGSVSVRFASVIARPSSQPRAHRDPKLERALAEIWQGAGRGLTVERVARRVHMGRRHLHRLFIERLGRSPSAEIQRAKVEAAKRMLCSSTASLAEIAAACGFSDQAHMSRAIKRATGTTPGSFRLIGMQG